MDLFTLYQIIVVIGICIGAVYTLAKQGEDDDGH